MAKKKEPTAGQLFQAEREDLCLSRRELGEILGRCIQSIWMWEHDRTPVPPWAVRELERLRKKTRRS